MSRGYGRLGWDELAPFKEEKAGISRGQGLRLLQEGVRGVTDF